MRARNAGRVEHHVGGGEQRVELGRVGREGEHLLARVPRPRDVAGEDVARGGHDPGDRGAQVGQHSPGARRRVAAQVDDPDSLEQPLRHGRVLPLN